MSQTDAPILRVAAIWGTTVLQVHNLKRGASFVLGDGRECALPMPDGVHAANVPLQAVPGGWQLDASGCKGGVLALRGRTEDPAAVGAAAGAVAVMPGDYGLLQYGQFALFFQYVTPPKKLASSFSVDALAVLALVSATLMIFGFLGILRALSNPVPIAKPGELLTAEELASRFGMRRSIFVPEPEEPVASGGASAGGSSARSENKQSGGEKAAGPSGKLGNQSASKSLQIPNEQKGAPRLGGLSDVLEGEAGKEVQKTLASLQSVSSALSGLSSKDLVLGPGTGTGVRGAGGGGGGSSTALFGAGTMQTGWGQGAGGGGNGSGNGTAGSGNGNGGGAGGNGSGAGGAGNGAGERKITVAAGGGSSSGGLSTEQVRRVVMSHTGALRACYEGEAQKNPNLQGGVTVAWSIDPSGAVTGASVASSTLGNARVEGCVVRQVRSWKFPTADKQTSVGAYPFKFGIGN